MIRRINYTGRRRILREDTKILLYEREGKVATFDASLDLKKYGLSDDASVYVEAYRQTSWMRFDFGVVGEISPPDDRCLTEFDSVEGVLFRVKVTSTLSSQGKLLAEGDQIHFQRPEDQPDNRIPLLHVAPRELGHEIAKIDFEGVEPLLLVNSSAGNWRGIALSPVFIALVYPQVFREILTRILVIEGHDNTEDSDKWTSKWLRFATSLPGISELLNVKEDSHQIWDWIDDAVASFAKEISAIARFEQYWREESSR